MFQKHKFYPLCLCSLSDTLFVWDSIFRKSKCMGGLNSNNHFSRVSLNHVDTKTIHEKYPRAGTCPCEILKVRLEFCYNRQYRKGKHIKLIAVDTLFNRHVPFSFSFFFLLSFSFPLGVSFTLQPPLRDRCGFQRASIVFL